MTDCGRSLRRDWSSTAARDCAATGASARGSGMRCGPCYGCEAMPNVSTEPLPQRLAAIRRQLKLLSDYL